MWLFGRPNAYTKYSRDLVLNKFLNAVAAPRKATKQKESVMLWTICVILIVLWLLGLVTSYTMGGLIHILLVIAIIVVLVRVIQGRKIL
jgi:hypothetical protein